ncbi:hypothetical protein [Planktotalea arctica]|uniref:hypothetical protein n=1 Tax=Planktotalea arctica TaxID=1481893 RepID=UPI00321948EF
MTRPSHFLGALLVALIALTAQSAALARTMPDAAGQIVLCTGNGPLMVYVDEEGQPTEPPHLCPDYALSLIVALDVVISDFAPVGVWQRQCREHVSEQHITVRLGARKARGPPVLI